MVRRRQFRPTADKSIGERSNTTQRLSDCQNKKRQPSNSRLLGLRPHGPHHAESLSMTHSNSDPSGGDEGVCSAFEKGRSDILAETSQQRGWNFVLDNGVRNKHRKIATFHQTCQQERIFTTQ